MIKLIVTDLDGTILDNSGNLNEEFEAVFNEIDKKGIIFMAASGRQYPSLLRTFESVKDKMMYIAENGTFVVYKGKELLCDPIDKESVNEIIDFARKSKTMEILVNTKYTAYVECKDEEFLETLKIYCADVTVVDDLKEVNEEILKVSIYDRELIINNCKPYFDKFGERMSVCTSGEHWLDIMKKGVTKGKALETIKREYGLKDEEIMIFGDQMNDLELIECGYYSYAMENAIDELKENARFIAGRNDENGVLEKIKEVLDITI